MVLCERVMGKKGVLNLRQRTTRLDVIQKARCQIALMYPLFTDESLWDDAAQIQSRRCLSAVNKLWGSRLCAGGKHTEENK